MFRVKTEGDDELPAIKQQLMKLINLIELKKLLYRIVMKKLLIFGGLNEKDSSR